MKGETWLGSESGERPGTGMEARLDEGLLGWGGDGLVAERGRDACDIDWCLTKDAEFMGEAGVAPK